MANGDTTQLQRTATDGAIAADQRQVEPQPVLVGPTTSAEFNTIGERLIPKGCFRFEDVRFEFDSSFVRPEVKGDMPALANLIERHTVTLPGPPEEKIPPPLSIFGHADPVGNDDYNKQLSGRRALAIYAMLVRDVEIWEQLFTQPFGGDKWGDKAVRTMLNALGHPGGRAGGLTDPETKAAVKDFQAKKGLGTDGTAGSQTRKALYRDYMEFLCGPRLRLDKEKNFLARHKDGDGLKGDVQGCSEFNPVRMFSQEENKKFEKETDKTERNQENAPNRRVMALLFAPGRRVNPQLWPCPRVKEGVAACRKRFFPDAEKRRSFQGERREFEETKDTFACRFYQIISDDSPCERAVENRLCCKHRGVVVSNVDPEKRGRLQVRVPDVLGDDVQFALPCVPYAGAGVGFFAIPPIGANVWIDFEAGDRNLPIWSGCFWAAGEAPPEIGRPEQKVFMTENMTLIIDDQQSGGSLRLEVGTAKMLLQSANIEISNVSQTIELTTANVSINKDALQVI